MSPDPGPSLSLSAVVKACSSLAADPVGVQTSDSSQCASCLGILQDHASTDVSKVKTSQGFPGQGKALLTTHQWLLYMS